MGKKNKSSKSWSSWDSYYDDPWDCNSCRDLGTRDTTGCSKCGKIQCLRCSGLGIRGGCPTCNEHPRFCTCPKCVETHPKNCYCSVCFKVSRYGGNYSPYMFESSRGISNANALAGVLEKTDRLLGYPNVKVTVIPPAWDKYDEQGPAATNGEHIMLNGNHKMVRHDVLNGVNAGVMLLMLGWNYHELAHVAYSPRYDYAKNRWLYDMKNNEPKVFQALMILEEQRIETLFSRRYSPAIPYFNSAILSLMLEEDYLTTNYLLIGGRFFVPAEVKQLLRDNFVLPKILDQVDVVVTRYVNCAFPRDKDVMIQCAHELAKLLEQIPEDAWPKPGHGDSEGNRDTQMYPSSQESRNWDPAFQFGQPGNHESEADKKPAEAKDGKDGQGQGGKETDVATSVSHKDMGKADEDGRGGSGAGHSKNAKHELETLVKKLLNGIEMELAKELSTKIDAVRAQKAKYTVKNANEINYSMTPASAEAANAAREIERIFRKLQDQYRPGWHHRKPTGKIDPNRVYKVANGETEIFKRWWDGVNNVMDFEIVMLLDISGSMNGRMHEASTAIWVMHKALKRCNAEITVLGYTDDEQCYVLMQRGEKSFPQIRVWGSGGGTSIMPAMNEAERIFSASTRHQKMCTIVTDGGIADAGEMISVLASGIFPATAMVGIESRVEDRYQPGGSLKISKTITRPLEIVEIMSGFVTQLIHERAQGKRR